MRTMPISKFKATCLASLEKVRKTGEPLRITRFGQVVADIVPAMVESKGETWMGAMRGTAKIVGDITGASSDLVEWDVLK